MKKKKDYVSLSQGQLIKRRFFKHKVAIGALVVLIIMYLTALFANFLSPYDPNTRNSKYVYAPPNRIRIMDENGFSKPFIYEYKMEIDDETWERIYTLDKSKKQYIDFFSRGEEYKILGIFTTNLRLFQTQSGYPVFLFGSDKLGRDLFSRILTGSQISLTIGLIGVFLSLIIGIILGSISGVFGGVADTIIQRIIEVLVSIPQIPLWMALSAALPADWPMINVYFGITVILSIVSWTGIARVVRGKFLSLREEEYVLAAQTFGASKMWVIRKHMIPAFSSYIIVNATLAIPNMILGETSLSFLGLGLRAPAISWGVLLQDAQNIRSIAFHPWLLIPGLFVIVVVLAFNFLGDGLRDAVDPYSK